MPLDTPARLFARMTPIHFNNIRDQTTYRGKSCHEALMRTVRSIFYALKIHNLPEDWNKGERKRRRWGNLKFELCNPFFLASHG